MKKLIALLLLSIMLIGVFCGCGETSESNSTASDGQSTVDNVESKIDSDTQTESKSQGGTHIEYVYTYFVSAEQGAVVTWFDSKTGDFRFKTKCETCGKVGNIETSKSKIGNGSYNHGFTCINSQCSMWGKGQRAIVSGTMEVESIEVSD